MNIAEVKQSVNGCNETLSRDHGLPEEELIPSLQGHRQALEQERCFPAVLLFITYYYYSS